MSLCSSRRSLLASTPLTPLVAFAGFREVLPDVLYTLVEKVGSGNVVVSQAAVATMLRICDVLNVEGIRELVTENMDYLVSSIVVKLRDSPLISESVCRVINVLMSQGCPMVLLEDVVGVVLSKVDGGMEDGRIMSVIGIMSSVVKSVVPVEEDGEGLPRVLAAGPRGG